MRPPARRALAVAGGVLAGFGLGVEIAAVVEAIRGAGADEAIAAGVSIGLGGGLLVASYIRD